MFQYIYKGCFSFHLLNPTSEFHLQCVATDFCLVWIFFSYCFYFVTFFHLCTFFLKPAFLGITTQSSWVTLRLVCRFFAHPNPNHSRRRAKPPVFSVGLPLRLVLLLTLLLGRSFFHVLLRIRLAPSGSKADGLQDLPHAGGIIALTKVKVGDRGTRS